MQGSECSCLVPTYLISAHSFLNHRIIYLWLLRRFWLGAVALQLPRATVEDARMVRVRVLAFIPWRAHQGITQRYFWALQGEY